MYRIGIIGCGKIAQVRHIPEYLASGKAVIAAFYDLNKARAEELAKTYNAIAYDSVDALLESGLDAVSVCTSNATHAEITIKALKKGISVLCEKPMAVNLEEAEAMAKAAAESGKVLMIGQNQRLNKTHRTARDLIRRGDIGKVLSFRTIFGHGGPETWSIDPGKSTWFFDKSKARMGAMADLGIHKTDLIDFLLDDTVSSVSASLSTLDKKDASGNLIGVDDNAICIYTMKKGAIGTMSASWTYYGEEDNSTTIYGTEGIMVIYGSSGHSITVTAKDGSHIYYDIDRMQTNDAQTSSGVIDEFLLSLDRGWAEISADAVLPAMRAVFAAIESSEQKKEVKI
ncbi:MAG: Gfo/Idh/MocA family oxidoreductase [Spirochaetes bacterium]|uniref:Gfo/Idh/MocA family oxidoreductase n=1 Tax=Candidatus Ornithospirochaeta stercoripullorum TaxID=2840899 RepID=A0A9D9H5T5_9SPIO|nr:Gfo/Idh/MocA family oxidoreductase [Candidatus Ornithospirochaeta stercoripullorum]